MKLTFEQLYEVMLALQCGLSAAAWEGVSDRPWWELSDEEKTAILAAVRSANEKEILGMNLDPETMRFNQLVLDRLNLASVRNEERQEEEARRKLYSIPAAKRGSTSGLRQAVNDLLSQSYLFSRSQRRAVECRLAARKLPKLTMLEAILRKKHEKILKRGSVRNEQEYYLVQEILASGDFQIDEESRNRLAGYANDFASRRKPR
jgi:hypothetical protein